jgi:hypothetical protein
MWLVSEDSLLKCCWPQHKSGALSWYVIIDFPHVDIAEEKKFFSQIWPAHVHPN